MRNCPRHSPKVPAAGFAPASFRLEGGGLSCSATREEWRIRSDSHRHCSAFEARLTLYCRRTRSAWLPAGLTSRSSQNGVDEDWPRHAQLQGSEEWSLHEDLHLDFRLRRPASCLLDDEGVAAHGAAVKGLWVKRWERPLLAEGNGRRNRSCTCMGSHPRVCSSCCPKGSRTTHPSLCSGLRHLRAARSV